MKNILLTVLAISSLSACNSPAVMKINTPAVQTQILGDVEKDLLAGGGALLISGGNGGAAVAAMTAQEVQNIPALKATIAAGTPATLTTPAAPAVITPPAVTVVP